MFTKEKLLEDFQKNSIPVFKKAIEYLPEKQKKEIVAVLDENLKKVTGSFPGDAVLGLKALKDVQDRELDAVWLDAIEEATANLPELVKMPQEDLHYKSREGNSPFISVGKFFKRIRLGSKKTFLAVGNGFRRMLKRPEKEFEVETREAPLRTIARSLLLEITPGISKWNITQARFTAGLLEQVQFWAISHVIGEDEEENNSYQDVHGKWVSTLEEQLQETQKELYEFLDDVEKKMSDILEVAGTIEHPVKKYTDEHLEKKKKHFTQTQDKNHENWEEITAALAERIEIAVELVLFEEKIEKTKQELVDNIDGFLAANIESPLAELEKQIEASVKELKSREHIELNELGGICDNIQNTTSAFINNRILDTLNEAIENKTLASYLEEYIHKVTEMDGSGPEQSILIEDLDISGDKPKYDIREANWTTLVNRILGKHIVSELTPQKTNPEGIISAIIEDFNEIIQIVDTNLELAEEAGEGDEAPVDIVLQGLERTLMNLDEMQTLVETKKQELYSEIEENTGEVFDQLGEILKKQDHSELKWMQAQMKVQESAGGWQTKFTVYWARFVDRIDLFYRFLFRKYRHYYDSVTTFLGLKKVVGITGAKTNLATFLYETDQKIEELPFIYRRLFDFHRDVEASFFIRNPIHFDICKKAHDLRENGFPSSLVVLGEKGSGKSTLLRFLTEEILEGEKVYNQVFRNTNWKPEEIIRSLSNSLDINDAETADELIQKIRKNRKGSTILIENLQNCYLRNMKGYGALNTMLHIIAATKHEVFWIVSCSRYAWDFMNVVFKTGDYFSHSLETDRLSTGEIESMIMKRQKASGYQLWFEADQATKRSRSYKKLLDDEEAAQQYLREKYFEKLGKMAEGNATVAMILWIRSIKEFNESYFTIESFDFVSTDHFDTMDSEVLFSVAAFILHDALTNSELAKVMNASEEDAGMIISRLVSRGILVNNSTYYTLNDLIYRQLVRLLKARNVLH